jgi:hypothetical protein
LTNIARSNDGLILRKISDSSLLFEKKAPKVCNNLPRLAKLIMPQVHWLAVAVANRRPWPSSRRAWLSRRAIFRAVSLFAALW